MTDYECNIELLSKISEMKAEIHELRNDLNQIWRVLMVILAFSLGVNTYDVVTPSIPSEPIQIEEVG